MIKRTLLTLFTLFTLINGALQAQKLGFIAGPQLNYGNVISLDKNAIFQALPNAGFHAGMMYEMDFSNRWGFDAAAMYEMRNMCWNMIYTEEGNETSNKFHRQIGYLNVPAHLFVYLTNNDKGAFTLFAGPVFTCGLHARDLAYENGGLHKPVTYMDADMFQSCSKAVRESSSTSSFPSAPTSCALYTGRVWLFAQSGTVGSFSCTSP